MIFILRLNVEFIKKIKYTESIVRLGIIAGSHLAVFLLALTKLIWRITNSSINISLKRLYGGDVTIAKTLIQIKEELKLQYLISTEQGGSDIELISLVTTFPNRKHLEIVSLRPPQMSSTILPSNEVSNSDCDRN